MWNLSFHTKHHGAINCTQKSAHKIYGDFQPWLLCIRSGLKVASISKVNRSAYDKVLTESGLALYFENVSHPWMDLRRCKAQSECYCKPKHM
jgi:hypothetical protein